MNIVEYNIVQGDSPLHLTRNVMAAIRDGFQPFGCMVHVSAGNYHQPVVKYEEAHEKTNE